MRIISNMNELPSEVLTKIFEILSLHDRKQVRLTCPFWYHSCNSHTILDTEKFVFRIGDDPMEDIVNFLLSCKYIRPSLEFQGIEMRAFPETVWKSCGEHLQYLHMHECRIDSQTLGHIISHCISLKHFHLQSSKCFTNATLQVYSSSNILTKLIANKIVRRNLTTFNLFFDNRVNGSSSQANIIQHLFQIYPNIKNFGYGFLFPVNSLFLANQPALASITTSFQSNGAWMREFSKDGSTRLQEVETVIDAEHPFVQCILFNFFSYQITLKVIRLTLNEFSLDTTTELLFHILKSCQDLKELQISTIKETSNDLHLSYSEFLEFWALSLRLHRLKLNFVVTSDSPTNTEKPISLNLQENCNMRILELGAAILQKTILRLVIDHYTNLQHLTLEKVADGLLQKLFSKQTNIRTLILLDVNNCSISGFTGRPSRNIFSRSQNGYSIKNLERLEHLEICGLPQSFSKLLFSELQFRHLKYLVISLSCNTTISVKKLHRTMCRFLKRNELSEALKFINVPSLEVLVIDAKPLIQKDVNDLCKSSTKLKFLFYAQQITNDNEEAYKELFKSSPSLRFIGTYGLEPRLTECHHKIWTGEIHRPAPDLLHFHGSIFSPNHFKY